MFEIENQRLLEIVAKHRKFGINFDKPELNDNRAKLFDSIDEEAKKVFPEGSVMRTVWEDQVKNCKLMVKHGGSRRNCRYSPTTIKVAILLKNKLGRKNYEDIRELFLLPTGQRLQDSTRAAQDDYDGILFGILKAFFIKAENRNLDEEWQRCSVMCFDAMSMRGKIFYNYNTGEILGFPHENNNVDAVLSELRQEMESTADADDVHPPELAKHYLVIYFAGLGVDDLAFPIARYALTKITGDLLYDIVFEIILALENYTFHVVASAFDGAGENRSFHKMAAALPASKFLEGVEVGFETTYPVAMPHPTRAEKILYSCSPTRLTCGRSSSTPWSRRTRRASRRVSSRSWTRTAHSDPSASRCFKTCSAGSSTARTRRRPSGARAL